MELKLNYCDRLRISTDRGENFIDISGMDNENGINVIAYPIATYIEIRKKDGKIATFFFKSKRHKKEANFGFWEDAEIIFALNEVKYGH